MRLVVTVFSAEVCPDVCTRL